MEIRWRKNKVYKSIFNLWIFIVFSFIFFLASSCGWVTEPFAEILLSSSPKYYLAEKDVNVRSRPQTKSLRVSRLHKNERIKSAGRVKGTKWVAVEKNQKIIGYVYNSFLVPIIDGRITELIKGNLSGNNVGARNLPLCNYKIKFDQKSKVDGDIQIISDYLLGMECDYEKKVLKIKATMFLTELPYLRNKKPIYQINIDISDILMEDEDMFSVSVLYDAVKNNVKYHSVSMDSMKSADVIPVQKASDVISALKGAVFIAHKSWGDIIWAELAKGNGEKTP
jgi:hypothetical protein